MACPPDPRAMLRRRVCSPFGRVFLVGLLVGVLLTAPAAVWLARRHWPLWALQDEARVPPPPATAADLAAAAPWLGRNDSLIIVYWTTWFGRPAFETSVGPSHAQVSCPARCYVTNRRALLPYAKGVVFHMRDLDWTDLPPRDINGVQPWVVHTAEPPTLDRWPLEHPEYLRVFDYSMTYRRDADIPATYMPENLDAIVRRPLQVPLALKETGAAVVWVQSNCGSFSHREKYMKELMALVPVHSYGHCMRTRDTWPTAREVTADGDERVRDLEVSEIFARYRFAVVAENSDCDDYITEKLLNALTAAVVPIVGGPRARYASFLPTPDAALFMDEHTPEELAARIEALAHNDTAYLQLLSYREGTAPDGGTPAPLSAAFNATVYGLRAGTGRCGLCMRLHEDWASEKAHAALERGEAPAAAFGARHAYSPVRGSAVRPDRSCITGALDPDRIRRQRHRAAPTTDLASNASPDEATGRLAGPGLLLAVAATLALVLYAARLGSQVLWQSAR